MKLSGREAARFCGAPDRSFAGMLIYGEDGAEVSERRRRAVAAALGGGEGLDLRLTEIAGADLRRKPALALDAIKAQSFFDGPRVACVTDATDGCAAGLAAALEDWAEGDGFLVVTAGMLPARSKLRKLFEDSKRVVAAPVYRDTPDAGMVSDILREEGVVQVSEEAMRDLVAIASGAGAAALREMAGRLALYMLESDEPARSDDVAACAPGAGDVDIDDLIDSVAGRDAAAVGPAMARMQAQGVAPTAIAIAAARRFRQMHGALVAADSGGLDNAVARLRPPVFGPRRDRLARHCRDWGLQGVEGALKMILETDRMLRGGSSAAGGAILERTLLRLAVSRPR